MPDSVVYFLSGSGGIKIGVTTDLSGRLRTLNTGSAITLKVISSVAGDHRLERELHRRLKHHRIRGEWFEDCDEVRTTILRAGEIEVDPPKPQNEHVAWASKALPALAHPRPEHENIKSAIGRVACKLGFKYSRVFGLWYGKARTLTINERDAISKALEGNYA